MDPDLPLPVPVASVAGEVTYTLPTDHDAYNLLLSPSGEMATFLLPADGGTMAASVARAVPDAVLKAGVVETFSTLEPAVGDPHCLVCNVVVVAAAGAAYSLFDGALYTTTSRAPVLATLECAVEAPLDPRHVHSRVICSGCYDLADRLDQLQEELRQARDAVRRLYWHTAGLYQTTRRRAVPARSPPAAVEPEPAAVPEPQLEVEVEVGVRVKPDRRRPQRVGAHHEPGHYRILSDGRPDSPPPAATATDLKLPPADLKIPLANIRVPSPDVTLPSVEHKVPLIHPEPHATTCNELDIDIHVDKARKKRDKAESRLTCRLCGKAFQRPSRLHEHEAAHTEVATNQCHVCSKTFSQKYYLREHIKQVHERRSLHSCGTCGKVFMRRLHLDDHVRTHSGERPYKCEVCGRGFSQRGNLRSHALVHTDQFPYQCDSCGKRLRTRQAFESHQRKHNDDRRFTCDLCSATFLLKRSLERHQRKHTGARPFKCAHCDRAFRDRGDLRCHEDIHSAQRAHVCPLCGLGFTRRYKMLKHLASKHGRSEQQVQDLCLLQQTAHDMLQSQQGRLESAPDDQTASLRLDDATAADQAASLRVEPDTSERPVSVRLAGPLHAGHTDHTLVIRLDSPSDDPLRLEPPPEYDRRSPQLALPHGRTTPD